MQNFSVCFLIIILEFITGTGNSQSKFAQADSLFYSFNIPASEIAYKKINPESNYAKLRIATIHLLQHEPEKANAIIKELNQESSELPDREKGLFFLASGFYLLETCDFYSAYQELEKAEASFEKMNSVPDLIFGRYLLGRLFKEGFSNHEVAWEYLHKTPDLHTDGYPFLKNLLEFQKARILLDWRNLEEAEYRTHKAEEGFLKNSPLALEFMADCKNLLGLIHLFRGDHPKAIASIQLAIKMVKENKNEFQAGKYYDNLGVIYWTKNPGLSKKYLMEGARINEKYKWNYYRLSSSLLNLGSLFASLKEPKKALVYFNNSRRLKQKIFEANHQELALDYYHIGWAHDLNNNLDSSEHYYERAYSIEHAKLRHRLGHSFLKGSNSVSNVAFSGKIIMSRYQLLKKKYSKSINYQENLKKALNGLLYADTLMLAAQKSYEWENTKASLINEFKPVYESTLECLFELYTLTNENSYLQKALIIMERTKYAALLDQLKNAKLASSLRIPSALLVKERMIRKSIYELQLRIASHPSENQDTQSDIKKIIFWNDSLKVLTGIIGNINIQYDFYQEIPSIVNDFKEPVVEYFYGINNIFSVAIYNGKSTFLKLKLTSEFKENLQTFYHFNSSLKFAQQSTILEFKRCSFYLYNSLLSEIVKTLEIRYPQLLIVPDVALSWMPWDALITKPDQGKQSYRDLSYLLYQFTVRQTFSLSVLAHQNNIPHKSENNKNYGFAFSTKHKDNALPGALKEAYAIADHIPFKIYSGHSSSKEIFLKHAKEANILHLSTHGIYDSTDWRNNALVFSDYRKGDTLRILDIYDLSLPSNLIVLSSCESALGKIQPGEGVMSFARAMTYAGTGSVITSLWKIPDGPTAKIFDRFYYHLTKSISPASALKQAKIEHLTESDNKTSLPFFWAGFYSIGKDEIMVVNLRTLWIKNLVLGSSLILILVLFIYICLYKIQR